MYYIYEESSTLIMGKVYMGRMVPDHRKTYKTHAAAQAALTRASKQWWNLHGRNGESQENNPLFRMGIAEVEYFHKVIERTRPVENMMTGEYFSQPVNTPAHMSPANETYWSM